jgi:hypothetical protein
MASTVDFSKDVHTNLFKLSCSFAVYLPISLHFIDLMTLVIEYMMFEKYQFTFINASSNN